jgi:hypothetical protein|tara:strand:- start:416 stop:1102 length:687 start_codon:yes stop_codon:yes gene_type:complete
MDYKSIKELKNIHKGEDIWLILAGSSMDYVDKEFFENKIVIGQNHVYKHYPCDYIIMKDCMEEPRFPRSIRELDKLNIPLVFSEYFQGNSKNNVKNLPEHSNAYLFKHNPRLESFIDKEIFELKENKIMVSRSTVTSLMHLGAFMGAKNLMLCGHDCGKINDNLYYDGYMEKDWVSAGNWSGITTFLKKCEKESQVVRKYLKDRYDCNIHSLNPFLNLGLEGNKFEEC